MSTETTITPKVNLIHALSEQVPWLLSHLIKSQDAKSLHELLSKTDIKLTNSLSTETLQDLLIKIVPSPASYNTLKLVFDTLISELGIDQFKSFIDVSLKNLPLVAAASRNAALPNVQLLHKYVFDFNTPRDIQGNTTLLGSIILHQEEIALFLVDILTLETINASNGIAPAIVYANAYKMKPICKILARKAEPSPDCGRKMALSKCQPKSYELEPISSHIAKLTSVALSNRDNHKELTSCVKTLIKFIHSMSGEDIHHSLYTIFILYSSLKVSDFPLIESIETTLSTHGYNNLLVSLYNHVFTKERHTDNVEKTYKYLTKALSLCKAQELSIRTDSVLSSRQIQSISEEEIANTYYNSACFNIDYSRLTHAEESLEDLERTSFYATELSELKGVLKYLQLQHLTPTIENCAIAFKDSDPREIELRRLITQSLDSHKESTALDIAIPTTSDDISPILQMAYGIATSATKRDPDLVAASGFEAIKILLEQQNLYDARKLMILTLNTLLNLDTPTIAQKLISKVKKTQEIFTTHNSMNLAYLEYITYYRVNELHLALNKVHHIHQIYNTLAKLDIHANQSLEEKVIYVTRSLFLEGIEQGKFYIAKTVLSLMPSEYKALYSSLLTSQQKQPTPQALHPEDVCEVTLDPSLDDIVAIQRKPLRVDPPLHKTLSPLPREIVTLSTMLELGDIKLESLHPKIQDIYFRYTYKILEKQNLELINEHNSCVSWIMDNHTYIYNPRAGDNNTVYQITVNLYATINPIAMDGLDQTTQYDFTNAIKSCRIAKAHGQHGVKILGGTVELKHTTLDERLFTNVMLKNPQDKVLIEFIRHGGHAVISKFNSHHQIETIAVESIAPINTTESMHDVSRNIHAIYVDYLRTIDELGRDSVINWGDDVI